MSRKSLVPIALPADPTNALEAAPKQYVDAATTVFTTSVKGVVPASGGGTTNFMRADGTWAAPPAAAATNPAAYLMPSGALGESMPRSSGPSAGNALTSGRMHLTAIPLLAGQTVTSLSYANVTAAGTPTSWWFALYDSSLTLLRQTANQGSTAWPLTTLKTLNLSSTYPVVTSGLYYAAIMVTASSPPQIVSGPSMSGTLSVLPPILSGSSTTGLTTTAPSPAAAIAALGNIHYCYAS